MSTRTVATFAAAGFVIAGALLLGPSCVLTHDDCTDLLTCGGTDGGGGGKPVSDCRNSSECDDKNPCTTDTCNAGFCAHTPVTGPGPSDGRPCTQDLCTNGVASHDPVPAGTPCGTGSTLKCDATGDCPPCMTDADCGTASADSCTTPTCDPTHTCVDQVDVGKKLPDMTPGGCTGTYCSSAGTPTMMPYPIETSCTTGGGKVCDGSGTCVACASNGDCSGSTPVCGKAGPMKNQCTTQCQDGVQDGNETGVDCGGSCPFVCQGGACTTNGECATGFCVSGVCCATACTGVCQSCNMPGKAGSCENLPQGTNVAGCASPKACGVSGSCVVPEGGACTSDSECDTGFGCGYGVCRLGPNSPCMDPYACASGLCALASQGMACFPCSSSHLCTHGMCDNGTMRCTSDSGMPCGSSTDCTSGACTNGLCLAPNGATCVLPGDCASNRCSSGKCAACATSADCSGATCSSGVCLFPSGAYCTVGTQCNSGVCTGFPPKCA